MKSRVETMLENRNVSLVRIVIASKIQERIELVRDYDIRIRLDFVYYLYFSIKQSKECQDKT